MKTLPSILRVVIIALIALFVLQKTAATANQWAIIENPVLLFVWLGIILFSIAIEVSVASLQRLLFHTLPEEAKQKYLTKEAERNENRFSWLRSLYNKLVGRRKIRSEQEILLDHDYDGIKELDNNLPPWWLYAFYASIIFAVVYMVRFHVFDGPTQADEYNREVAEATIAIAEYRKTAKNLVDASSVTLLTDAADLAAGKSIFESTCVACHRIDGGGGIGPNLTDSYWIFAGEISAIFKVISEGGRPGKGMISWKNELKPLQIAQVGSYILSLQGTNPPDAKAPEGELWKPDGTTTEEIPAAVEDSTLVKSPIVPEEATKKIE
ncbi:MAG: cytochrome C oxidase subunit III [Flavobacteriaceae bacterium CG_4_8_14_3_um_filter_34_10]|nr:c-type cytochrome [Flavobacteriia bacterium]OIP49918.1 MAG: cytochrome C oxidase subunit III [Flavobacteriaceae bacterium CG2_30_34_30]PIQ19329.1 MAG: cytochrome C oxidase subunit III [Flavobacteriaceae bacterium CG18_big_fil_WC_8_21_14_2_50_34_36]PIV51118.1 MAG: cytochrome C oxidase subunit III [Flavobacteriaceae bacterium CG02_land_8_20_14_3_00_34_13]PIX09503.1 MAG: cytochrome C oxidase subunit III [Flavobacteriaceae bacterium CG_4_8_14_3_um_filter_34_10]PIZ07886.1 MAG: cytochrome C oxida